MRCSCGGRASKRAAAAAAKSSKLAGRSGAGFLRAPVRCTPASTWVVSRPGAGQRGAEEQFLLSTSLEHKFASVHKTEYLFCWLKARHAPLTTRSQETIACRRRVR